jgi:Acetyltransferases, including N-acetylases of ribosomal proteins
MLRSLLIKDAPLMLEWMHDKSVVEKLNRNFAAMTISDCEGFIRNNMLPVDDYMAEDSLDVLKSRDNVHLAIICGTDSSDKNLNTKYADSDAVSIMEDNDEYMGTVSLKDIDRTASAAEFAITIRKAAMGRGLSAQAMVDILELAHDELGIKTVYWYVNKENVRAVRFYDKNGYRRCDVTELVDEGIKIEEELVQSESMLWYIDKKI